MPSNLDQLLDECLARLWGGRTTIGECLERYPTYAAELGPLLRNAEAVWRMAQPTTSRAAFDAGKERMLAAVRRQYARPQNSFVPLLGAHGGQRGRRIALVTALALLFVAAASVFLHLASQRSLLWARPASPLAILHPTPTATLSPTAGRALDGTPEPTVRPASPLPSTTPGPTELFNPTDEPAPGPSPEPTGSPPPSASPEPTHTPEPTEPREPTPAPEPTHLPRPTDPPEPTASPKPTPPPEPTHAPEPTDTGKPTYPPEPTATGTSSPTRTPSMTPTPTHTTAPTASVHPW